MPAAFVIGVFLVLGILFVRDSMRLNRWVPELFREGPIVFHESRAITRLPESIPTPELRTGLFYDTEYRTLGPTEVAFTAQTFSGPLLLGVLEVHPADSSLTATARLHWTSWPLFLVGVGLIGLPWPVDVLVLALAAANYLTEVRSFRRVLDRVADVVNNGLPPEIEAPVDWDAD